MGLFIPKKIRVGFQKRSDTFTGKLAYVIYYDEKGKIRKEGSFNSWTDASLGYLELENEPRTGFVLNKGVKRDGYWGSGHSLVRVHDDRGFEFEISIPNLMSILMHSDVSKRDIVEKCIFAWSGTNLVLLPCNSQEYLNAQEFTSMQDVKLSAKDLREGFSYKEKKSDYCTYVYMGHMAWNGPEKKHVFWNVQYKSAESKSADILREHETSCHEEFAVFLEKTKASQKTQPQALSPKKMVVGGLYKKAYDSRVRGSNLVYIGQFCAKLIQDRGSPYCNYFSVKDEDFKKKHVFFDKESKTFVSQSLSGLEVNLEPSRVADSELTAYEAHFKKSCIQNPTSKLSFAKPLILDQNALPGELWVDLPSTKYPDGKMKVKVTENEGSYDLVQTAFWSGSNYMGDFLEVMSDSPVPDRFKQPRIKKTGLSFEEILKMSPSEIVLEDGAGVLYKREDLYKKFQE